MAPAASRTTDPPIPITGPAMAKWGSLTAARTWPPHHLMPLAAYCAAWGRWVQAEAWLADPEHGPVVTIRDDKGNIKSHGPAPQLTISERSAKEMERLGRILGRVHL